MTRIRIALASVLAIAGLAGLAVSAVPGHTAAAAHSTASGAARGVNEYCC